MTSRCRPRPRDWAWRFLKTWAAARPSLRAVSAVTGSMFAVPRTPSVPKIFRVPFVMQVDRSVWRACYSEVEGWTTACELQPVIYGLRWQAQRDTALARVGNVWPVDKAPSSLRSAGALHKTRLPSFQTTRFARGLLF